jgi:hypothetical protein
VPSDTGPVDLVSRHRSHGSRLAVSGRARFRLLGWRHLGQPANLQTSTYVTVVTSLGGQARTRQEADGLVASVPDGSRLRGEDCVESGTELVRGVCIL